MSLGVGAEFAGYTIVRLLGSGGMGEVYLAQHPRLPRRDALKVLRADISGEGDFRQRFVREADLAAALSHPNIVTVYDRGESDGQLWIAAEYVDGTDALQLMHDVFPGGMPPDKATAIITAIAQALDYAHQAGMLHRDVKPANILVAEEGASRPSRIALADFGIAREIDDPAGLTHTNLTLGTVSYAAPEQLMGEPLSGRADQYALAVSAFHLLTGSVPFENSNPVAIISQHLSSPPPKLGSVRPELAAADEVFDTALAKDPGLRYPSCTDFAMDLARRLVQAPGHPAAPTQAALPTASEVAAAAPTQAAVVAHRSASGGTRVPPPTDGAVKAAGRSRTPWIAAAAVAAALVAGGAWIGPRLLGHHEQASRSTAQAASAPAAPLPPQQVGATAFTDAQAAAEAIQKAVPEITQLVALTELNDDNNLIGRPNGYSAAVVLVDSRSKGLCDVARPGMDCGATVEQWPDAAAAQRRLDYIQGIRNAAPALGSEWTTRNDNLLLRVTGELPPSAAKAYEAAFTN
ncbi:MAG: serine/threonine protein kinase [Mycobacterium sp.]|nr:serine/threonine protein kinase [Mycobacterium sp.]